VTSDTICDEAHFAVEEEVAVMQLSPPQLYSKVKKFLATVPGIPRDAF
jgi:hypothetical protein